MKKNERIDLENQIEILKYERNSLHRSYIAARQDVAVELLNILLDEPYSIYIDEKIVFEIATDIYGLKVKNGRVQKSDDVERLLKYKNAEGFASFIKSKLWDLGGVVSSCDVDEILKEFLDDPANKA